MVCGAGREVGHAGRESSVTGAVSGVVSVYIRIANSIPTNATSCDVESTIVGDRASTLRRCGSNITDSAR